MKRLIFIGGVGKPTQFGGELTKNKFLLKQLGKFFDRILTVDTFGGRRAPWRLFLLPVYVAIYPTTPIVISTSYRNVNVLVKILKRIYPKRNVILWVIGGNLQNMINKQVYSQNDFMYFSNILVEGEKMRLALPENIKRRTLVVPNFKDCTNLPDVSCKKIKVDSQLRFVFFSRIMPEKGVDLILSAVRTLNENGYADRFIVHFYGDIDANYEEAFNSQIQKESNVEYCGTLNFFDASGLLRLSTYHLTLFPTYWYGEGFPGVVVDSYMAGVPILASDWNLNSEIISEETGFLVPAKDELSLRQMMERIVITPELLAGKFEQVQHYATKYDVKTIVNAELISKLFER